MVAIKFFRSAAARPRPGVILGVCLVAFSLTGCANHKIRQAEIGCVSASAQMHDGVAAYNEIKINGPTDPAAPRVNLKMPSGQVLDRKSFTYVALKKAGFEDVQGDPQQPSTTYDYKLAKYGATFVFFNGTLVEMNFMKTPSTGMAIGRERSKTFYSLPLTQKQLEELFGHPEKMSDSFHL